MPESRFASFDRLRQDVDKLHALRAQVSVLLSTRRSTAFDGLGDFLDRVLPEDDEQVEQIGRALRILPGQLTSLRHSELDPNTLPVAGFIEFARCVGLDKQSLIVLIERDHGRYSRAQEETFARGAPRVTGGSEDIAGRINAAWDQVDEDDPTGL
jgi:hypothetical protein